MPDVRLARAAGTPASRPSTTGCRAPSGARRSSLPRPLMHVACDGLDVIERCGWQDAVAEIEDVPRPAVRAREHVVGRGQRAIDRTQEDGGIEVALNRAIEADALPRFVERRPPVGADHLTARVAQISKDRAGAHAEVNRRNLERFEMLEDPPR